MDPRREKLTGVNDSSSSGRDASSDKAGVAADEVTCQEFVELITDYLEGALTSRTQSLVEEHLVMCDWCVTYTEQMEATLDSMRALREEPSLDEPEPSAAVLAALQGRRERSE
jgi:predicted anti-sigma-YlaC factor YlaD